MPLRQPRRKKEREYTVTFRQLERRLAAEECTLSRAALHYGIDKHTGLRKDEITPEHMHQIVIASRMLNRAAELRRAGINVDRLLAIVLTHDIPEDDRKLTKRHMRVELGAKFRKHFPKAAIESTSIVVEKAFGLSKFDGERKLENGEYFEFIAKDPYLLLAKLGDCEHNTDTIDNLPPHKQAKNFREAQQFVAIAMRVRHQHPKIRTIIEDYATFIEDNLTRFAGMVENSADDKWRESLAALKAEGLITTCKAA